MNRRKLVSGLGALAAALLVGLGARPSVSQEGSARVYELRTYTTLPARLPALHRRFAEHTLRLFERHGMRNEMYWTPTDSARRENTLIYVISHASREAADASWKAFGADPEWIKARTASEADGPILAKPSSIAVDRETTNIGGSHNPRSRPRTE